MWKKGEKYSSPLFLFYLKETQMMPICKHSDSQKNEFMNPENMKILTKWENMIKYGEK